MNGVKRGLRSLKKILRQRVVGVRPLELTQLSLGFPGFTGAPQETDFIEPDGRRATRFGA